METLRAADRRVWGWSALVWLLASVVGAFWALPHVEDELDEESLGVESYTTTDGAVVRWNGRDGYLRVPEGTANAEAIAADLADITGTRDVEISYTASLPKPADLDPANFEVTWDPDGATGSGVVPDGLGDELNDLFATGDDLRPDASRSLGDDVVATLESVVAPIIGSALVSGTVNVAENEIAVTGVAPDAKAKAEIEAELSAAGVTHEITVPSPDPATFTVVWDRSGSEQTGDAPADLSDGLRALGVAAPLEGDNVTVGDNVAPTLAALAPLVGTDLISGTVSVDDAAVVITGTAPSQEALDRATAALAESGAAVDLELSGEAQAQTSIDSLLALGKIEFVSGTATPTPATPGPGPR